MPVKFYRIEHDEIGAIAERYGASRPGPDRVLEQALGPDYATRWDRPGAAPGFSDRVMAPASITPPLPGHEAPAAIAAHGPLAIEDATDPGRSRMTSVLKAAGVKGMTIKGLADQLTLDGREVAHQTVYRWLTEEAAAGRVVNASYGRWKWLAD
jgi:hypothetical protein